MKNAMELDDNVLEEVNGGRGRRADSVNGNTKNNLSDMCACNKCGNIFRSKAELEKHYEACHSKV